MNIYPIELPNDTETLPFGDPPVHLVATFGEYEAEYAAIKKSVAILHLPQRGVISLTGDDRQDFLNRLLTQDIKSMTGGASQRAFAITNKGRIVADMTVHHGDASTWLVTDRCDATELIAWLDAKLFSEDVKIENWCEPKKAGEDERETIALYGPKSAALIDLLGGSSGQAHWGHWVTELAGEMVSVSHDQTCGATGYLLHPKKAHAKTLYKTLVDAAGFDFEAPDPSVDPEGAADAMAKRRDTLRGRPIGWLAFNTARIEAGRPLFHIDFGPDSLPHETGIVHDAVSFKKGCYPGQEIVARMENLAQGHPKRLCVGLKLEDARMPIAGSQVYVHEEDGTSGAVIGGITSSTVSPLVETRAIALATVKWGMHEPGTKLRVPAEGAIVAAEVVALPFV